MAVFNEMMVCSGFFFKVGRALKIKLSSQLGKGWAFLLWNKQSGNHSPNGKPCLMLELSSPYHQAPIEQGACILSPLPQAGPMLGSYG